ncbi:DUF5906 domain-containing protein [Moellerella wisconsensis]|uniref:DUF5906 domain-containing protein n=1 Tax=Moellerella wisconsensis TaxID=158849 RepID=A0A9Q8V3P6_9GAMM|nr:DUF5906 domain-containing protein [Moellerella wisconsensis]UNH31145.1 DUF5906 domain-containing protein [Moellerella wisconsensis]
MSIAGHKKLPEWSDSLFATVYLWVKRGTPPQKADTDASILRYPQDHRLNALAICMRSLVMEGDITPDWFTNQGYHSANYPDKAEDKRKALVLEHINDHELRDVLSDVARADYLWPREYEQPKAIIDLNRLGDGARITAEDIELLNEVNKTYTHVYAFGDHHIVSMRPNPVTGETHCFQTLNSFRNNFLDQGRIAGRRLGEAWLSWPGHSKQLGGVGFYPNPESCSHDVYNLYTGLSVEPVAGDVSPYLEHLEKVICAGDNEIYQYLTGWLAHLFQKPEEKPSVAIVMKSIEGTGKGSMVRPLLETLGMYAIQVNGSGQIAGRFNSTIANKLFVFVDEADLTDGRSADKLKAIISEDTVNLERKGKDPEIMPNYARFIFASNRDRVINAGLRERRYLVLEPDAIHAQNKGYFDRLHHWINDNGAQKLLAWLLSYDLSDFDPRRAPVTAALVEEKLASMPAVYQFIYSELWSHQPFKMQNRANATELVDMLINWSESNGESIKPPAARSAIGRIMKAMGIQVMGRSDRGDGRYYDLPEISEMKRAFAAILGEKTEKLFT